MLICTIRSMPHPRIVNSQIEDGLFELAVQVNMAEASASGDPSGFVKKEISRHLAGCVEATDIPLGEDCWAIKFTTFAQNNFGYPEGAVV